MEGKVMRKIFSFLPIIVFLVALNGVGQAALINPGFETGDFTGWTTDTNPGAPAEVVTSHDETPSTTPGDTSKYTYSPMEGNYFALLKTGVGDNANEVYQQISLAAGDTLSGYAAFDAGDFMETHPDLYPEWNDYAYVRIYDSSNTLVAEPWYCDVETVGDYSYSNWELWAWTTASAGNFTLVYGVVNYEDLNGDSYALHDTVPLPGSVLLLGSGLMGLGLLGWRRKVN